eukprot:gene2034-25728_t
MPDQSGQAGERERKLAVSAAKEKPASTASPEAPSAEADTSVANASAVAAFADAAKVAAPEDSDLDASAEDDGLSHHGQHGDPLHTESDAQFAHLCDMVVLMLAQLDSSFSELIHWKNVLLDNLLPPNVQVRLVTMMGRLQRDNAELHTGVYEL